MKKSLFLLMAMSALLFVGASSCAISWSSVRGTPPPTAVEPARVEPAVSPADAPSAAASAPSPASSLPEALPASVVESAVPVAEVSPSAAPAVETAAPIAETPPAMTAQEPAAPAAEPVTPAAIIEPTSPVPAENPAHAEVAAVASVPSPTEAELQAAAEEKAAQEAAAQEAAAREAALLVFEPVKDASDELRFSAMKAEAAELAPDRFAKAEETRSEAGAKYEAKDYVAAAEGYTKAGELYELSEKKARANSLREEIFANGYAKYSAAFFQMGEDEYQREDVIWDYQGPVANGKAALEKANEYYGFVVSTGAEYKSFEGKDKAQGAREAALGERADLNAPESFASAEDIMAEAVANQGRGSYESAYLWFGDASAAYGTALDESLERKAEAEGAIQGADAALGESEKKAVAADLGDNDYLEEGRSILAKAKARLGESEYLPIPRDADLVRESALRSDTLVQEKIAAEAARAAARPRLDWAMQANIESDHPAEYARARSAMSASDIAFARRRFAASTSLAEEVGSILSDEFRERAYAERQAATWGKAQISEFASGSPAGALVAQTAQSQAKVRMEWADQKGIKDEYPLQYETASKAMLASYIAYGGEDYDTAIFKADEVNRIFSDTFMARVEQERETAAAKAARIASEKAAAEAAMADARTRIVWAENNGIQADYPVVYSDASTAMEAAELSYPNDRHVPTRSLAESVSALITDDFMARVLRERRLAEEAVAQKAADRTAAQSALADAEPRMIWANENGIAKDFPGEFGIGSAAMGSALTSFGKEEYSQSTERARLVSATFSDAFAARVAAERRAAGETAARIAAEDKAAREMEARKAAEKMVEKVRAESALADAKRRMAWANSNGIASEYQTEYKTGSTSMVSSLTSFGNEEFTDAAGQAKIVSETFSDEFMARVEADRQARRAATDKAAADRLAAEAAAARAAADKAAADRAAAEAAAARAAAEKAAADRAAAEAAAARAAAEKAAADRAAAEAARDAAARKAAADKAAADKAAADRAAAEAAAAKATADKLAAEKAAFAALPVPSFKLSLSPQNFSPDGDGQDDTLNVSIAASAPAGFANWKFEIFETAVVESAKAGAAAPGRLFASWSGKGEPPASISWNGKSSRGETVESATDYGYRMTATDSRGKSGIVNGSFTVDVLVIREGDKLKINVPSIVFRANFPDFIGLAKDVVAKNDQVVKRIAQILNRFPGYRIVIQGHANSISKIQGLPQAKIQAEEKNELIPLSRGRAEYIRTMLVRFGVDAKRLSAEGLGSSDPVVSFSDAENRWKNRRVEFILVKTR